MPPAIVDRRLQRPAGPALLEPHHHQEFAAGLGEDAAVEQNSDTVCLFMVESRIQWDYSEILRCMGQIGYCPPHPGDLSIRQAFELLLTHATNMPCLGNE